MALSRDALRQHFETIDKLITEEFSSNEGRRILDAILNRQTLSGSISSELILPTRFLEAASENQDRQQRRLSRLAMSLAILSSNEDGYRIAKVFRQNMFEDHLSIVLELVDFSLLTREQMNAFCVALQSVPVEHLDITGSDLSDLHRDLFNKLFFTIRFLALDSLVLFNNNLERVSLNKAKDFFRMIRFINLTKLDIRYNKVGRYNIEYFKLFCRSLQASMVINLHITHTALTKIDDQKHKLLFDALMGNFYLQYIHSIPACFSEKEKKEIESALTRNKFLHEAETEFKAIIKTFHDKPDAESANEITEMLARIKACRKQLNQVGVLLAPYASSLYVSKLNEKKDILMIKAAHWLKHNQAIEAAIKCYLRISPQHAVCYNSHFEAFELTYTTTRGYDKANQVPASIAFIQALPCCLDTNNHLIFNHISRDRWKVLSGYLCAAVGINANLAEVKAITAEKRLFLLQYILVRNLCDGLSNLSSTHSVKFFQEREKRLLVQFAKLPVLTKLDDIKKRWPQFNEVWKKALAIVGSLPDTTQVLLFKATARLAKEIPTPVNSVDRVRNSIKK